MGGELAVGCVLRRGEGDVGAKCGHIVGELAVGCMLRRGDGGVGAECGVDTWVGSWKGVVC